MTETTNRRDGSDPTGQHSVGEIQPRTTGRVRPDDYQPASRRQPGDDLYQGVGGGEREGDGQRLLVLRARAADPWAVRALEINLRVLGTTHPFLALKFLTGGAFDSKTGLTICSPHCIARLVAMRDPAHSNWVATGSR